MPCEDILLVGVIDSICVLRCYLHVMSHCHRRKSLRFVMTTMMSLCKSQSPKS